MSAPALREIEAGGIHFLERPGTGDHTIVLLHGIGGRSFSFASTLAHWPAGPRLLAWDCPGFGRSQPVNEAHPAPEAYAAALSGALNTLGVARIGLMGQSLGALFAGTFAARHPERVARLALMCPAQGYRTAPGGNLPDGLAKRIADHQNEGVEAYAAARAARLVQGPERKREVVEDVRRAMASIASPGHSQAVHALAQGDLPGAVPLWRLPVLLLAGADDVVTPLAGTEALFALLRSRPRGPEISEQLHVIGDAGHAVYLEHPAAVAAVAQAFFGGEA